VLSASIGHEYHSAQAALDIVSDAAEKRLRVAFRQLDEHVVDELLILGCSHAFHLTMEFEAQARALYSRRPANVKVSQGGLATYLALSGPVCSVEPPRTREISRISLQNIRNRGLVAGESWI
jgi:hypothetical protein